MLPDHLAPELLFLDAGWTAIRGEGAEEPVSSKRFAFVQAYDQKPNRWLFEMLQSQGHQLNQQITLLSDDGEQDYRLCGPVVRDLEGLTTRASETTYGSACEW